jgi:hypothetical protein
MLSQKSCGPEVALGLLVLASLCCLSAPVPAWAGGPGGGGHGSGASASNGRSAGGPISSRASTPSPGVVTQRPQNVRGVVPPRNARGVRPFLAAPYPLYWFAGGYPWPYPGFGGTMDSSAYPQPNPGGLPYPASGGPDQVQDVLPPSYTPTPSPGGGLHLDVRPTAAQVYVDGYYTGLVSDFISNGGLNLEPGTHQIELRAPGYQTTAVDVKILPQQPATFRAELQPLDGAAEAPAAAAPITTTFYLIARCYMGNVPPTQVTLPPDCDPAQMRTFQISR